MFAFPEMLITAAEAAGIKIPKSLEDYEKNDYPHWYVFEMVQIGASMPYPGVHYENAKVIAEISDDEIRKITYDQLIDRGFRDGKAQL